MSHLAQLLKADPAANAARPANPTPQVRSFIAEISNPSEISRGVSYDNRVASDSVPTQNLSKPDLPVLADVDVLPLSRVQEAARQNVIARLAAHPEVQRAFVTSFEGDMLIVALGVRGVGTCELAILTDRVRAAADYAALLECLDDPEGTA